MADAKSVLYSPYGGFQLKATYQRNLLLANLVVIAIVAGLVISASLWGNGFEKPEQVIEVIEIRPLNPFEPLVVTRDVPAVKVVRPKHVVQEGSIWRPVADEEFGEESLVYAGEEIYAGMGPVDGAGIGDLQGISGGSGTGEEIAPPREKFIPLEKQPEMVAGATPQYPRMARKAGISGAVWIRALIDKKGKVRLAEVYKSSGSPSLDDAALRAAYRSIFSPGIQNGRAVLVWVTYKVEFKLED